MQTPLESHECKNNTSGGAEDYVEPHNDTSTILKNIGKGSINIKDGSPSTPTTCLIVLEVVEHDAHMKDNFPPSPCTKDTILDDVLEMTTQKSHKR